MISIFQSQSLSSSLIHQPNHTLPIRPDITVMVYWALKIKCIYPPPPNTHTHPHTYARLPIVWYCADVEIKNPSVENSEL